MKIQISLIYLICGLLLGCENKPENTFTITNTSAETIKAVRVQIADTNKTFTQINPKDSVKGEFKIKGDDHYKIEVEFMSGRKLQKEMGYITNGLRYDDNIKIAESDVLLKPQTILQ